MGGIPLKDKVHPRALLPDAREVARSPDLHDVKSVITACDLMISYGTISDLNTARVLKSAIERGQIKPGRTKRIRRACIYLAALTALVWVVALGLERIVVAQQEGRLPPLKQLISKE